MSNTGAIATRIYYDTDSLFNNILANPGAYGLTNVTDPCFDGIHVCANPDQYLFWDNVHPTAAVHAIIAQEFERAATTPEPTTLVLAGTGLAYAIRRRRYSFRRSG